MQRRCAGGCSKVFDDEQGRDEEGNQFLEVDYERYMKSNKIKNF